jgi:outer membrane protein assembly factor BamE (lipoprotein component of BamABCDE complex)
MNGNRLRTVALTLAMLAAGFVITACAGTHFKWDAARQIRPGMTEQQVTALLGPPYMVTSSGGEQRWTWSYADTFSGARAVSITLRDGKVTGSPSIPERFH